MQGQTFHPPSTSNNDLFSVFEAAQGYVMLGRNKALDQLFIMDKLDPSKVYASPSALLENERMNARSLNANPIPWDSKEGGIRVAHLNICRLKPHLTDLRSDPTLKRSDLLHLSETWLDPKRGDQDGMSLEGFHHTVNSAGVGKGLATYGRQGSDWHPDSLTSCTDFQMSIFSNDLIQSVACYRSSTASIKTVTDALVSLLDDTKVNVIMGDFNVCTKKKPGNLLTTTLLDLGFSLLANEATQLQGGTIVKLVVAVAIVKLLIPDPINPRWCNRPHLLQRQRRCLQASCPAPVQPLFLGPRRPLSCAESQVGLAIDIHTISVPN